jgi:hypothetical protein
MPDTKSRGLFVAVGHNGVRVMSENGADWKNQQTGKEGEVYRAAGFGNGRFVAVGSYGGGNIFAASADGVKWDTHFKDAKYVKYLRGLGFGNGKFLGIGGDPGCVGCSNPFVSHSTDGAEWTEFHEIGGKHILRRVAWGNKRFAAVGDRGRRAASADGDEWKDAPDAKALDTLVDVAFGKSVFVGVGLHGLRMLSDDGVKWEGRQLGEEGEHLNSIVWADDRFVAVGMGGTWTSADGRDWQRRANKDAPLTVAYGNGVFVGASWKGRLLRSTDAIQWEQVHKCDEHVEAVAFGSVEK